MGCTIWIHPCCQSECQRLGCLIDPGVAINSRQSQTECQGPGRQQFLFGRFFTFFHNLLPPFYSFFFSISEKDFLIRGNRSEFFWFIKKPANAGISLRIRVHPLSALLQSENPWLLFGAIRLGCRHDNLIVSSFHHPTFRPGD